MNTPLFFGSAGDERGTPQAFFDKLNAEFHFDIDCAASKLNHKCDLYFGEGGVEYDALEADWAGMTCFLNPPYSVAGAFVQKARDEADKGATVVLLLPVRSDTKWWHKHIWDASATRGVPVGDEIIHTDIGSMPKFGPIVNHKDGNWRPGVRCRFIPGRLNFELVVPDDVRTWIKNEHDSVQKKLAGAQHPTLVEEWLKEMGTATGLPKMAIERILIDYPDEDLMEAAPFPSCVVIFTKA